MKALRRNAAERLMAEMAPRVAPALSSCPVLWTALRALEENAELRWRMANRAAKGPTGIQFMQKRYEREARDAQDGAAVLREVLANGKQVKELARNSKSEKKARQVRGQSVGRQKGQSVAKRRAKVRD